MNNDILESASQRGYGAYDAENRRIKEISDELQNFADYMRRNLEQGKKIEAASK